MKSKNPMAVGLGQQSAKARRKKLGKNGFRKAMRALRLKALKDKAILQNPISVG